MDARRLAWKLSLREDEFPTRLFGRAADEAGLNPQETALARELLGGILRRRGSLDAIVKAYTKGRVPDPQLMAALRLGLYQLLFLSSVPPHAALHTTLEAVKPECRAKIGFLNAVLRAVTRGAKEVDESVPTSAEVMQTGNRRWRFDRKVLADPVENPARHLADVWSQPEFLVKRWLDEVGEEQTLVRLKAFDRPAALGLRVNSLRTTREEVRAELERGGIQVVDGEHPLHLRVTEPSGGVAAMPGFHEGHWAVQDATALDSLALAAPKAGERILDLCAAPGGKSFAAFELTGGEAEILACDVHVERLERMSGEQNRLGHEGIRTQMLKPDAGGEEAVPAGPWDLILCDVPCSNTGVLHKRPEARWRFDAAGLRASETLQNLLRKRQIVPAIGPTTRVLWMTCSLEPEENRAAVDRIARDGGLELQEERFFEPDVTRSGGYAALLVPKV